MRVNGLRAVFVAWLNAFQRSRVGVGMNWSVSGEVISVLSDLVDWIPRYIRIIYTSPLTYNNCEIKGAWWFLDFGTFPPDIFRGLFLCHRGYCHVCETSEIAFVAICVRSSYKMPGLKGKTTSVSTIITWWGIGDVGLGGRLETMERIPVWLPQLYTSPSALSTAPLNNMASNSSHFQGTGYGTSSSSERIANTLHFSHTVLWVGVRRLICSSVVTPSLTVPSLWYHPSLYPTILS